MKAHSVGVETTIERLTLEEIKKLSTGYLKGKLMHYEFHSKNKREIPFELRVRKEQKEFVEVVVIPKKDIFWRCEENYTLDK